jgi:hypothetical protein
MKEATRSIQEDRPVPQTSTAKARKNSPPATSATNPSAPASSQLLTPKPAKPSGANPISGAVCSPASTVSVSA